MVGNAEDRASKFYNTLGWETEGDITEDAKRWEDLREYAKEYVSKCRLRVLRHIPDKGVYMLDMADNPWGFENTAVCKSGSSSSKLQRCRQKIALAYPHDQGFSRVPRFIMSASFPFLGG